MTKQEKTNKLHALAYQLSQAAKATNENKRAIRAAEEEAIKSGELQAMIYRICDKMDELEALKIIADEFEREAAIDQLGERMAFDQWARGLPSCNAFEFLNFQGPNGDKYPARHALEEIEGQSLYTLEEDEAETILIGLIFQAVSQYRREGERMGALIEKRTAEA